MSEQPNIIAQSKLLRWMIRYAFADKFNLYLFGGDCCRHEIHQSLLIPESSSAQGSIFAINKNHETADLLVITGPLSKLQVPQLIQVYNEMAQPKWVMVLGSCGLNGGYLAQSPLVETSIADYIPVDVVVAGCPVRPHDFLEALMELRSRVKNGELPRGLQ